MEGRVIGQVIGQVISKEIKEDKENWLSRSKTNWRNVDSKMK
jgi:hypothetical protein